MTQYLLRLILKISVNRMKKVFFFFSLFAILTFTYYGKVFAQSAINEDELFSTPESIFETEKIVDTSPGEEEKKSFGITPFLRIFVATASSDNFGTLKSM